MIYLYVKTHNKTGLKYLGKTEQDPYKYPGSGKRWKRHIKKHGKDITTQILLMTESKDELKETGLFFSKLWNVVESNEWANCKPEEGDGGWNTLYGENNGFFNKKHSEETKSKISAKLKGHWKGDLNPIHKIVAEGKHNWQGDYQKNLQTKLVKEGKHHLLGTVPVINKNGIRSRISKDEYYSQSGPKDHWEYINPNTTEGKRRKSNLFF
jgi:hypothetical protein